MIVKKSVLRRLSDCLMAHWHRVLIFNIFPMVIGKAEVNWKSRQSLVDVCVIDV